MNVTIISLGEELRDLRARVNGLQEKVKRLEQTNRILRGQLVAAENLMRDLKGQSHDESREVQR